MVLSLAYLSSVIKGIVNENVELFIIKYILSFYVPVYRWLRIAALKVV